MGLLHEMDGREDGDGHYEIEPRQGGDYTLTYVLNRDGKRFPFSTPLREIESAVQGLRVAARQVGVSPTDLFMVHVNETALTAPEHARVLVYARERVGWE